MTEKSFDLRLPEELRRELKIEAAKQGVSMNALIVTAIKNLIAQLDRETK